MLHDRTDTRSPTLLVTSCDGSYIPLAKGLLLSLLESGDLPSSFEIAFIDIGCDVADLQWMADHGITVKAIDDPALGELADARYGYQRAQICRPFLPKLFPDADVIAWMDCDIWVQDVKGLCAIIGQAAAGRDALIISPEVHASYVGNNFDYQVRITEMMSYYEPIYGNEIAAGLSVKPTLNSGLFAMAVENPIWLVWEQEIRRIYQSEYDKYSRRILHFGEQIALNYVARNSDSIKLFDSLYNYLCLWEPPFRDGDDVVRVSCAPYLPVGVAHLAGGWRHFGDIYLEKGLLYKGGVYLDDGDRERLLTPKQTKSFR
jgi:hypothetical protein